MKASLGKVRSSAIATWHPRIFEEHYEKHPVRLHKDCWLDILGRLPANYDLREMSPISKDEYRWASERAVEQAWLEFCITDEDPNTGRRRLGRISSIDERLVRSIRSPDGRLFFTCFHEDLRRKHERIDPQTNPAERIQRRLEKLERDLRSPNKTLHSIGAPKLPRSHPSSEILRRLKDECRTLPP